MKLIRLIRSFITAPRSSANSSTSRHSLTVISVKLLLICSIILVFSLALPRAYAQSNNQPWSTPFSLISGNTVRSGQTTAQIGGIPSMVADDAGRVHVFWAMENAIYYAVWDKSWSRATDILVPPNDNGASTPSAAVDAEGRLHVIWLDGKGILYHSWAMADNGRSAHSWTTTRIFNGAGASSLAVDRNGIIYVLIGQNANGDLEIYYSQSKDNGTSWSTPVNVSRMAASDTFPSNPKIAVDNRGYIHAVWSVTKIIGGSYILWSVDYSRSLDGGKTWSLPVAMATNDQSGITIAVDRKDNIHVVWNGGGSLPRGKQHRMSLDAGATWSSITTVLQGDTVMRGTCGMTFDSEGTLHLLMPLGNKEGEGVWYSSWDGLRWTEPILIPGTPANVHYAEAAVTNGNRLHAVWLDSSQVGDVEYATKMLSAPFLPSIKYPTPSATLAATETPVRDVTQATVTPSPTVNLDAVSRKVEEQSYPSTFLPILMGIIPVILILGVVMSVRILRG